MNRSLLISLLVGAVIVVGGIAYFSMASVNDAPISPAPAPAPAPNPSPAPEPAPAPNPAVNPSPSPAAASVAVAIQNYQYLPKTLTVKRGTTVTWTNKDSVAHTVTSSTGNTLNSPYLGKDQSWSYTFNTVGTYDYKCAPHPYMTGSVVVTD